MSLQVVGAGFGRTGTASLKVALEQLGFGPCYHMENVFVDESQLSIWKQALDGEPVDWPSALSGYRSAVDWPATHFWRELADAYPAAKVLLHVRPEDSWWSSFSTTIKLLIEHREKNPSAYRREVLALAHEMIAEQTFDGKMADKRHALACFRKRIEMVSDTIPPQRLLVFDVAEGWIPLCHFLEKTVPDNEFPHVNDAGEFWEFFGDGMDVAELELH